MKRSSDPFAYFAIAAALAIGTTGAVLSTRDNAPQRPAATWGAHCTLQVTPADGTSLADATDRALQVARARAAALGWTRYDFSSVRPGELDTTIEASLCAEDLAEILAPSDVDIRTADGEIVAGPLEIVGGSYRSGNLYLQLTDSARERLKDLTRDSRVVAVARVRDADVTVGDVDPTVGAIRVPDAPAGRGLAIMLAGGAQPSALVPREVSYLGRPPQLAGPVVDTPAWASTAPRGPSATQLRHAVTDRAGRVVYVARVTQGPSGDDWYWLSGPNGAPGGGPVVCGPTPGTPLIEVCPDDRPDAGVVVGRTAPEVGRVELEALGKLLPGRSARRERRATDAALDNGWFVIPAPADDGWDYRAVAYSRSGARLGAVELPVAVLPFIDS